MFEIMLGQQAKKENFMITQRLRIFEPEAWEANDKYIDSLIALSKNQKVVCDLHILPDEAECLANFNQVVFLIREM